MVRPPEQRLLTEANADTVVAGHAANPATALGAALNATYVPRWKANTAYLAGDAVLSPAGDTVTAVIGFTSGSTYNAGNWKLAAVPAQVDAADTKASITKRWELTDVAGAKGSQINLEHWGNGTGLGNGQSFGLDIHNNPGSKSAFVVHQYSNDGPAVRLDNTGTGPMLLIAQTNNPVRNPESVAGTAATGDAIRIVDHVGTYWLRVLSRGELVMTPPLDAVNHALDITIAATSTKNAIRINHNGASTAVQIVANAGSAGSYPLNVTGQNYGPLFSTSTNGGQTLRVLKQGTGNGEAAMIINQGTSATLSLRTASATEVARMNADGEYEHLTAGKGLLLKSPDGTRYRLAVANGGTVSVVAA